MPNKFIIPTIIGTAVCVFILGMATGAIIMRHKLEIEYAEKHK